jgi:hypothetical protein
MTYQIAVQIFTPWMKRKEKILEEYTYQLQTVAFSFS